MGHGVSYSFGLFYSHNVLLGNLEICSLGLRFNHREEIQIGSRLLLVLLFMNVYTLKFDKLVIVTANELNGCLQILILDVMLRYLLFFLGGWGGCWVWRSFIIRGTVSYGNIIDKPFKNPVYQ